MATDIGKNHVTPSGFDTDFAKIGYNHYIPSGLRAGMLCVNLTLRSRNSPEIPDSSERWLDL